MGLEYHMECFRKSNKEYTFRMNEVEVKFSPAGKTIWQQHGHGPGCRKTPCQREAGRRRPASSGTSCHPPEKQYIYWVRSGHRAQAEARDSEVYGDTSELL